MGTAAMSTWAVLRSLGFVEDSSVISDPPGGLRFDFGDFKLTASVCINLQARPIILFTGILATRREIAYITFEMPREVESWEQGVAWVTWGLDRQVGRSLQPLLKVDWLERGRECIHLLPWERARIEYESRPHCWVERDWARVALKKLAAAVSDAPDDGAVTFHFDGEILRVWCGQALIAVPATGTAWESHFSLPAPSLGHLPKRLMRLEVEFSIWQSNLRIDNTLFPGATELRNTHD